MNFTVITINITQHGSHDNILSITIIWTIKIGMHTSTLNVEVLCKIKMLFFSEFAPVTYMKQESGPFSMHESAYYATYAECNSVK